MQPRRTTLLFSDKLSNLTISTTISCSHGPCREQDLPFSSPATWILEGTVGYESVLCEAQLDDKQPSSSLLKKAPRPALH